MLFRCSVVIVLNFLALVASGSLRFTNLKCMDFDSSFATMETCNLKILQRGIVGMNVHVKIYKLPVTNMLVNLSLHKKANGYRPFLYNVSVDFCQFMRSRTQYPLLKIYVDAIRKDSNVNHTCPYNHDFIVNNYILKEEDFRLLPMPAGDYMFAVKIRIDNDWKADIKVFYSIKD